MGADDDASARARVAALLAGGLATNWERRAYTSEDVARVAAQLRQVARDDYQTRIRVAGFTPHSYHPAEDADIEQACLTCMYFERNRRYCNLPEIALPVEPEWSCIMWRI